MLRSEVTEAELEAALLRVPPVEFSREEPTLGSSSSLMSWGSQSGRTQDGSLMGNAGREAAGSTSDATYQASLLQQRQHAHCPIRVGVRVGIRASRYL